MLNTNIIKQDFKILSKQINGRDLVYLDNAATSQKPNIVIEGISRYYNEINANVHRGIHQLSEQATDEYESTRKTVSQFIGATYPKEVIFTSGTTESLNLVAFGWAMHNLKKGDVILTTNLEHHSNFVPWQIVAGTTGATLQTVALDPYSSEHYLQSIKEKITDRVKIVAITHASNVTGAIIPVKAIAKLTKSIGAILVVDGAQAIPHLEVNVKRLDCDFYAFSAHKILGPTGVGVLWGRPELLEDTAPIKYGGGMINEVTEHTTTWADLPEKLEAGTPNIAGVVGFSEALKYIKTIGMNIIREHEVLLNDYALKRLVKIDGLTIIGPPSAEERTGVISFIIDGIHPHDLASVLNSEGVAVRSGHHCNMPLHTELNIPASTRASFYLYNNHDDVDRLIDGILKAISILK